MGVILAGHLLGLRHQSLQLTQIHAHRTGVPVLLDGADDNVALRAGEVPVLLIVLSLADPLGDHLARGGRGHPSEIGGRVVEVTDHLIVVIELGGEHAHLAGTPVDLDLHPAQRIIGARIGIQQRILQGLQKIVEGDVPVPLNSPERSHIDIHDHSSSSIGRFSST